MGALTALCFWGWVSWWAQLRGSEASTFSLLLLLSLCKWCSCHCFPLLPTAQLLPLCALLLKCSDYSIRFCQQTDDDFLILVSPSSNTVPLSDLGIENPMAVSVLILSAEMGSRNYCLQVLLQSLLPIQVQILVLSHFSNEASLTRWFYGCICSLLIVEFLRRSSFCSNLLGRSYI